MAWHMTPHSTHSPQATLSINERRLAAALCTLCGALPIGIALGVIPVKPGTVRAPLSIVLFAGLLFWLAGASLLFGSTRPRVNSLLAAIILALFAAIGAWVSLFGTSGAFGGGLPIVSHAANEWISRAMFACGALVCAGCSIYALARAVRPGRRDAG
jgi:hypothetical protein